jgi:hypothetical protein
MNRWLLLCAVLSGCASPTPVDLMPKPGLLVTPTAIWLPDEATVDTPICANLFQQNSMHRWKCVRLGAILTFIDGMAAAN